ncbi:MAG: LacI family transcriptional regulator [Propionibacteriaceae bacterium]|nr:LacI family transcriptional regulator [Propionibacteriaceae bacterium]
MRQSQATIYEVAARVGVSISTVSLAINHPDRVAATTRDRILAAADDLSFVPKEGAVARAHAGVGRLAVVAPFTSYPSYGRRLSGMLTEVKGESQVLVYDHEDVATSTSPLLESLPVRGHVDGLVIMGVPLHKAVASRLRRRLPTVLVDMRHPGLTSVYVDDVAGGRVVGERLVELGHRRVAFVREEERSYLALSPTQQRKDGLVAVLGADHVEEITVDRGPGLGERALDQLLAVQGERPTAVVANRDFVALSIMAAASRRGLNVPEDLSIVGFDDDAIAEELGLTTVGQPFEESGALAVRLLREMIPNHGGTPTQNMLPFTLAERSTLGPAPAQ